MATQEQPFLTVNEAADYLRVSVSYVRKLTCGRHIPFRKLGKRVLYDRGELRQWADAKRVPTIHETVKQRPPA